MIKTFTENDLIRYVYGEASENEKTEIESAVICDYELEEKLIDLQSEISFLDRLVYYPSSLTLNNILEYSTSFLKSQ